MAEGWNLFMGVSLVMDTFYSQPSLLLRVMGLNVGTHCKYFKGGTEKIGSFLYNITWRILILVKKGCSNGQFSFDKV